MKRLLAALTLISFMGTQALGHMGGQKSTYSLIAQAAIRPHELKSPQMASIEDIIHPSMNDTFKHWTALNLFSSVDMSLPSTSLVELGSWNDLELYPSVFNAIDRTETVFGKIELERLVSGDKQLSLQECKRRQNVVKLIAQNEPLFAILDKVVTDFKKTEDLFLIFSLEQRSHRNQVLSNLGPYVDRSVEEYMPSASETLNSWDTSPSSLMVSTAMDKFAQAMSVVSFLAALTASYQAVKAGPFASNQEGGQGEGAQNAAKWTAVAGASAIAAGGFVWRSASYLNHVQSLVDKGLVQSWQLPFKLVKGFTYKRKAGLIVQKDLIDLSKALREMYAVSRFFAKKPALKTLLPECDAMFSMFDSPESNPEEVNQLLALLQTSTFRGEPSMLSHTGRIYAANKLMELSKDHWASVLKAVGQLDVYLSIAKLVKEFEKKRIRYSFVNFVEADKPVLVLKNFWNPLIDADTVVTNSIALGAGQGPRSMIITGPNSGGKSVVLKSVALSALLGQTLGIAPAAQATMTPFSTINTLINVSDVIPEGYSRFRAEVKQAQDLVAKLQRQNANEFNLVITDELFSSTSEDQAEELLYEYVQRFAQPNTLCLQATHHPRYMVTLEDKVKDGNAKVFENYKVDIAELPDGKLNRTYKLQRGVSSQKFARKILEEFGALPSHGA